MLPIAQTAPRAVRVIEIAEDGSPVHKGLLTIELGCRLVFSVKPNYKMDFVRAAGGRRAPLACVSR